MTDAKISQMDREKIEAAAKQYSLEPRWSNSPQMAEKKAFKAGVQWRDSHPSPAVLGLVEALKLLADKHPRCDCMDGPGIAREALAAYEESLK